MLELLLFLIPIYYILVSVKYYAIFKKTDLLKSEKANRYYRYIFFWPFFKFVETSPFERLAYCLFKTYGEEGVIYFGWGGFNNLYNDLTKGKSRYENMKVFVLRFELKKPIQNNHPFYDGVKFIKLVIIKKNNNYIYRCGHSGEMAEDDSWSIYDMDDAPQLSKNNLIDELEELHLNENEIQDLLQKL